MSKSNQSTNRREMMLHDPVEKVIPRLAVPSIISMLITTIYNMADTYFVSKLGTSASGSVGVIFSAMLFIQAFAFTFGMGSGTNISKCLGEGDDEKAGQFVATGLTSCFLFGTLISIFANLNLSFMVYFLGATDTIAPYAMQYARFIFFATPFQMCSLAMNNILRFEGLSSLSVFGIGFGGILNMALDPLFIFVFGLGTAGAAIATGISQIVSFAILLSIIMFHKEAIHFSFKNIRPALIGRIFYTGVPSLGRQGLASVATVILNNQARMYGDAAIAAFAIVSRYVMFINSTVIGFGQGFQPVCGISFGAKNYERVRNAFKFCIKVTTIILIVLTIISVIGAEQIVWFFRDDPEVIAIGKVLLRINFITIPLWGFIIISNMFSQAIGYGVRATIISSARQGFCLIPFLLIMPPLFGLHGLFFCQPLADLLTVTITGYLVRQIFKGFESPA